MPEKHALPILQYFQQHFNNNARQQTFKQTNVRAEPNLIMDVDFWVHVHKHCGLPNVSFIN